MCCLKYEDYLYAKEKGKGSRPKKEYAEAPQVGTMVATSMGKGKVTTVNKAKHTATVQLSRDNVVTLEWDELIDASQAMDDD
jgi:cell fate regulator YaaT (PSP1 superfamily)